MWNNIVHWFHHLLEPHCIICEKERKCPNCEFVLELLESERRDKQKLLELITNKEAPPVEIVSSETPEPIFRPNLWEHKKRELELAERKRLLEENERINESIRKSIPVEELEAELLND